MPTRPGVSRRAEWTCSAVGPEPGRGGRSRFLHFGPYVPRDCWLVCVEPGELGAGAWSLAGFSGCLTRPVFRLLQGVADIGLQPGVLTDVVGYQPSVRRDGVESWENLPRIVDSGHLTTGH